VIKKIKITFLLDENNNWIENFIRSKFKNKNKKFIFKISKNFKKVNKQDLVFILNYTKILPTQFLKKNHLNLVVHESGLPKGKGFAPVQWQILNNKKKIPVCLIEAVQKFDSGDIFEKTFFKLKGDELNAEIREKQANAAIAIIKKFLSKFPKIKRRSQVGKSTYFKRRYPKDSELNINKSLKNNFNLLRIADNEKYPAFFTYKKKKYFIKIFLK